MMNKDLVKYKPPKLKELPQGEFILEKVEKFPTEHGLLTLPRGRYYVSGGEVYRIVSHSDGIEFRYE